MNEEKKEREEIEMKPTGVPRDSELGQLIEKLVDAKKKFDDEHGDLILADDFAFPMTVSKILAQGLYIAKPRPDVGQLVKVRPVGDEFKDKTFLGILLGDLIVGVEMSQGSKSKALIVQGMRNPAIYIPALKRVVWGRGSWWAEVEKEDDLSKLITDEVIGETWYVKALASMFGLEVRKENKGPVDESVEVKDEEELKEKFGDE